MAIHHPLHILNQDEVNVLFKNSFDFHKKSVEEYFSSISEPLFHFKEEKTLNILVQISILCSIYNLDRNDIFKFIQSNNSWQAIKSYFSSLKKEISKKKISEKKIIKKGLLNRIIYGTTLPPLFQNKNRIYVKISKIPTLSFLADEIINRLNLHTPEENFSLLKQTNQDNNLSYFVIDENKKTKIGRFLISLIKQIELLKSNIALLEKEDFNALKHIFKSNYTSLKEVNKKLNSFLKNKNLSKVSIPSSLFFELKENTSLQQDEFVEYLNSLKEIYFSFSEQLHYIQIRTNKKTNQHDNTYADMIILSTNPRDISRMSEYTSWDTCMGQEDECCYDLPIQIGIGSIVAYLVNSKNPYKRLGRIILKPFVSKSEHQYIKNRLNFFNSYENKKKLTDFDRFLTFSYNQIENKNTWINFVTCLKKELSNFKENQPQSTKIYLPDQQYGIAHQQFLIFIKQILTQYINPSNTYGLFITATNFYRDKLQQEYYFPEPNNQNNLKEYLTAKNIPFKIVLKNSKEYICAHSLFAYNLKELILNGVIANQAKIHALSLLNLDERGFEVNNLTITGAEKLSTLPENLHIKNSLMLESDSMIILPSNINVKTLTVEAKNLKIIPSDIQVSELTLVHSKVSKLPPLSLDVLDAKHSKITDIRHVHVSNYLDLSFTPIQHLNDNLNVQGLFLRHCDKLKKLPKNLKTKWLDIGQTDIEEIPPLPYECLLMSNAKKIERLPHHISFNTLEAQGSGLKSLPDNLSAEKINLSKTNFQKIPKNLHITQLLLLNETPIQSLPADLIAKEVYANKTKISQIAPDTQIKTIHLIDTPLEVIHFSKTIQSIYLNKVPQFIHPKFSVFRFIGISEEDVKLAQQRYQMKYLTPIKITHHPNLNDNSSMEQFRTLE